MSQYFQKKTKKKLTPAPRAGLCDNDMARYVSAPRLHSLVIGFDWVYPPIYFSSTQNIAWHQVINAGKATFSAHAFPSVTRLRAFQVVSTEMFWLEDTNLDRRWWISDARIHKPPHYDQLETTPNILLLCGDSETLKALIKR